MIKAHKKSFCLSDGREIVLETGKIARQANGSVLLRVGNTMILATVVAKDSPDEGVDFLPLSVEYQEKFAATGKIPGGFTRREGKMTDHEVLVSRLIDRAIRPMFPKTYRCATQVNVMLLSADQFITPDSLCALAASAALCIAPNIPFSTPISEVKIGRIDGVYTINPSQEVLKCSDIDVIVAGSESSILMVEGEMNQIQEDDLLNIIEVAHEEIKMQCRVQSEFMKDLGLSYKLDLLSNDSSSIREMVAISDIDRESVAQRVSHIIKAHSLSKKSRNIEYKKILEDLKSKYLDKTEVEINEAFWSVANEVVRNVILKEHIRLDGRKPNEIRNIWSEIDYVPSAHGSALFTRGETQSLTTVTLGGKSDEQLLDGVMHSGTSKFMLHYNFPGFSTGEVKAQRGVGRREVGHGNLAMRALKKVLPAEESFPYTIRVVSDILESNGSSSMATVCAGSMALMDAGVPLHKAVSGIAMGLIMDPDSNHYVVLSDILGDEDALGDMDFKITGTEDGITACQMDIKVRGISSQIMKDALNQAKVGRLHILSEMNKTVSSHRVLQKPHSPRFMEFFIDRKHIGAIIGPGGRIIQDIQKTTGVSISIEEKDDKGLVKIFASSSEKALSAEKMILSLIKEPELGQVYSGKIKSIVDFGAFVEFMPGKDGLVHISEVRWGDRIENLNSILSVGQDLDVKLIGVDSKTGKYKLSHKALLPKPEEA